MVDCTQIRQGQAWCCGLGLWFTSHVFKIPGWFDEWFWGKSGHFMRFAMQGSLNLLVHGKNLRKIFWVTWLQVNEISLSIPLYSSLFLKCSVLQKFGNPLGKVGFWSKNQHTSSLLCIACDKKQVKLDKDKDLNSYIFISFSIQKLYALTDHFIS